MQDTSVIIAAAGSSTRMNGTDKQFADLLGSTVIGRTMQKFQQSDNILDIVVVTRKESMQKIKEIAEELNISKLTTVVEGGATRQKSVMNAISAISKETEYIAIHDGARPLVHPESIAQCIKDAKIFRASTLGVKVKDTIKKASSNLVVDTIPRDDLYNIQTPQVFKRSLYFEALNFTKAHDLDFTDDCQMVEAVGGKIYITDGTYDNIKITTPEDLAIAKALLEVQND